MKREPRVITQNGEAKMVIQDVASYEQTQETMELLKILALGIREYQQIFFKSYRLIYRTGERRGRVSGAGNRSCLAAKINSEDLTSRAGSAAMAGHAPPSW